VGGRQWLHFNYIHFLYTTSFFLPSPSDWAKAASRGVELVVQDEVDSCLQHTRVILYLGVTCR